MASSGPGEERSAATRLAELEQIYDALPIGIFVVDAANHAIRAANPTADALHAHWRDVVTRADQVERALRGTAAPRQVVSPEPGVSLRIGATPLRDDTGDVVGAIVTVEDLTEGQLRAVAEAEFVENAAHQLRSPATAIVSSAEALLAGARHDPEELERFVGHIARESERLSRLVAALLALARLQRGGALPAVTITPLPILLDVVCAEVRLAPGVELSIRCDREIAVVGDADMLSEAILNVVANAARHTREGKIRIDAVLDRSTLTLEVSDTGPGVPEAARDRIFQRFFQASPDRGGSGLGLAIAAEATRANRGRLELVPTEAGACFRFTLVGARVLS